MKFIKAHSSEFIRMTSIFSSLWNIMQPPYCTWLVRKHHIPILENVKQEQTELK